MATLQDFLPPGVQIVRVDPAPAEPIVDLDEHDVRTVIGLLKAEVARYPDAAHYGALLEKFRSMLKAMEAHRG